ncbi:hypothetical protein GCM10009801_10030 [Streptomyces albiaxialis]|uniref:DUF397 domain-containing protein n=1 Tax=Streptomyces albiaxialis TaxID=329523 RepID=A0ABN2VKZ7_9ACTN
MCRSIRLVRLKAAEDIACYKGKLAAGHSYVLTTNRHLPALRPPPVPAPRPDRRLHWASTETAPDFARHIEGALAAAERATRTILSA